MSRIRTISECLQEIRDNDPRSSLTYNSIKQLCLANLVKCFRSGNKIFVNFDDLLRYLSGEVS